MNTQELIKKLTLVGAKLSLENDKLRCHAPKGVLTKELRQSIADNKQVLLDLLASESASDEKIDIIPQADRSASLPLSFSQQRLWFIEQFEGSSAVYNIPIALRLLGDVDISALEKSFHSIIQRHEALRTNFQNNNLGVAEQYINNNFTLEIPICDVQENQVANFVLEESSRIFDLRKDLLIRIKLLRIKPDDHVLLITIHHIVADGWSLGVLVKDFVSFYSAHIENQISDINSLPIQYVDYACWQKQHLTNEKLSGQIEYWKQQLSNIPPLLELPTDHPRPAIQSYNGRSLEYQLSDGLVEKLKKISHQYDASFFMVLLAAFQFLLSKYSGQSDVVVGTPVANRNRPELEDLIGFFVNTLVLRTSIDENNTFLELLQLVKTTTLNAYANQDVPFEKLVDELKPERNLSYAPLFQVLFSMQNMPANKVQLPGLRLETVKQSSNVVKFDLDISLQEIETGLHIIVEYSSDIFNESTIKRLLQHYENILNNITHSPQRKLSELMFISESERNSLVYDFNKTVTDYKAVDSLVSLFEHEVKNDPGKVALLYSDKQLIKSLTYQELNERANQLARHLIDKGIGPDKPVGLLLERSLDMVVGVLAILKAGGFYVPLDPDYPDERLQFSIKDARAEILISNISKPDLLSVKKENVIDINNEELLSQYSNTNLDVVIDLNNLAYVIYTSGSTGTPKGVALPQKALINLINWHNAKFEIERGAVALQFASINFDVSFQEIFSTLCGGGTLVVASQEQRHDPLKLLELIQEYQIQRLFLPVVILQQLSLVALQEKNIPQCISEIITAGEALDITENVESFFKQLPECGLYNHYGPSESHVVTTFDVKNIKQSLPPIGKPIDNTQIYILDSQLQPVPVGVPGELCIAGYNLARGYIKRPDLTAEKFIPNPFSKDPGSRLYKTGDLARYTESTDIEVLGRIDNQIKLRGFRIELGEIEHALRFFDGLEDAAVVIKQENLIAYFVSKKSRKIDIEDIKKFLQNKLPSYMVPQYFVAMDVMPLTPSGKINRLSLPEPDFNNTIKVEYEGPVTDVQKQLSRIWSDVLNIEQVGISNNFFDLGGNSLLAMQVVARIRETLEVDVSVKILFENPVITQLSQYIENSKKTDKSLAPIKQVKRNEKLPLSYGQQRLWFLDRLEGPSATYNMPMAIRLKGNLNASALVKALQYIVKRHEILRSYIQEDNDEPIVRIVSDFKLDVPVIQLDSDLNLQALIREESQTPFALQAGPAFRAKLLQFNTSDSVLIINMHHIISDGWSISIIAQEFVTAYKAIIAEEAIELPALLIQYVDYACWQKDRMQAGEYENQLKYWHAQLSGIPALLKLPADFPRPAVQSYKGATLPVNISADVSKSLQSICDTHSVSLFMVLMAAFQVFLARLSGETDIAVGSAAANRARPELENLVGYFANIWVLRTDFANISNNPTFLDVVNYIKINVLNAYDNLDIPFDQIVDSIQPERDLRYSPLFQSLFILHNKPADAIKLSDLTVEQVQYEGEISKHDFSLNLWDVEGNLSGFIEYNTDIFKKDSVEYFIQYFYEILKAVSINTKQYIYSLPSPELKPIIQIAEVRSHIIAEPNIKDCALINRINKNGRQCYVAYVSSAHDFSEKNIENYLLEKLPANYLPTSYVWVSRLPYDDNGNLDEAALLALPVLNRKTVKACQISLDESFENQKTFAVIKNNNSDKKLLHISDLDSGWRRIEQGYESLSPVENKSKNTANNKPLALSDGGRLDLPSSSPQTLITALLQTVEQYPDKGIHFHADLNEKNFLSYSELLILSKSILNGLYNNGVVSGDIVLLQIKDLRVYFPVFWACVLGGITPVTVAVANNYNERNAITDKLYNTWGLLKKPKLIIEDDLFEALSNFKKLESQAEFQLLPISSLQNYEPVDEIYMAQPDDRVFIQLSSGSTGISKCIQETHQGIIHHIVAASQFNQYTTDDISLNWLPMDHVVPLLTCHLKDIYLGCNQIQISTENILAEPLLWLGLIDKYKVTHTWSPNFGYKLVTAALGNKTNGKNWDLSSIKFFMNAGEQVTLPVIKEFIQSMQPYGLSKHTMQPAFGMAEVCTCMTYQNKFDMDSGVHYVDKESLGHELVFLSEKTNNVIEFINLGKPVPGVQIRIADADNKVVAEGVVGRLQIKGKVVTPGYLHNDEANNAAFVGDGWFNSGDLGFIKSGELTLTGREKEIIIIHGANFYCYEIEDVVNQVQGVKATFAAACGIENPELGTQDLALFFVADGALNLVDLIPEIKKKISSSLGVIPKFIIPLEEKEFPKTTSGKIQRTKLKQGLMQNKYENILRNVDFYTANENTVPNWFYKKTWEKKNISTHLNKDYRALIISSASAVEKDLPDGLDAIFVKMAESYKKIDNKHYQIDFENSAHYSNLFECLETRGIKLDAIIYLCAYENSSSYSLDELKLLQQYGIFNIVSLTNSARSAACFKDKANILIATNAMRMEDEVPDYTHGAISGLVKSISQEVPDVHVTAIDFQKCSTKLVLENIVNEIAEADRNSDIRYDGRQRYISLLKQVPIESRLDITRETFKTGATYLVTGGLGGIGKLLSQYLLEKYQAKLILIGRKPSSVVMKSDVFNALKQYGGQFRYSQADLSNIHELRNIVEQASKTWAQDLEGVIHLAGAYHELPIEEETSETLSELIKPKVLSSWALHQILNEIAERTQKTKMFLHFSSVIGAFGGALVSAYSAANSFQGYFSRFQNTCPFIDSYCLQWSNWDDTGMSAGYLHRNISESRGYYFMPPQQALLSLETVLMCKEKYALIGLNSNKPFIHSQIKFDYLAEEQIVAYVEADEGPIEQLVLSHDEFNTPTPCKIIYKPVFPLDAQGDIDKEKILGKRRVELLPANALEEKIANIWKEVLGIHQVYTDHSFFEVGGNSLLAVSLLAKLEKEFSSDISLAELFQATTILQQAELLNGVMQQTEWTPLVPLRKGGGKQPIFLIHPGAGAVVCYKDIINYLDKDHPVYGIQAQGLVPGQQPLVELKTMVSLYFESIKTIQPTGPYYIAGWSFGGGVAYELAKYLETIGESIAFLGIIDATPKIIDPLELASMDMMDDVTIMVNAEPDLKIKEQALRNLDSEARLDIFMQHLENTDGFLSEINREQVRCFLNVSLACVEIRKTSVLSTGYKGKVSLFLSEESLDKYGDLTDLQWSELVEGKIERYYISGDHKDMVFEPAVKELAEKVEIAIKSSRIKTNQINYPITEEEVI